MSHKILLPAEWHKQSAVQLTWPHMDTDWRPYLKEAQACFTEIAREVSKRERLLIVCQDCAEVRSSLVNCNLRNITFAQAPSNDTWARDHGGITIYENDKPVVLDFGFNGWGEKFNFALDNQINRELKRQNIFARDVELRDKNDFILEGGSIDSDGAGTLITTGQCLLSPKRNPKYSKEQLSAYLCECFGLERVIWLVHGNLVGDDTDGHVDTLVKFCSPDTLAYVQCLDESDCHYRELKLMEDELKSLRTKDARPYKLIPLPLPSPCYEGHERLPAAYANFLIINEAVLVPIYGVAQDELALARLKGVFPDREVIGINCRALIKQHGSLHCVTMQYPEGVFNG